MQAMALKALVIGMGVLIVIGLAVVIVTIASRSLEPEAASETRWRLPPGAEIAGWRLAGSDLVVRLDREGAVSFWTFDRRSGQRRGEIVLESDPAP